MVECEPFKVPADLALHNIPTGQHYLAHDPHPNEAHQRWSMWRRVGHDGTLGDKRLVGWSGEVPGEGLTDTTGWDSVYRGYALTQDEADQLAVGARMTGGGEKWFRVVEAFLIRKASGDLT